MRWQLLTTSQPSILDMKEAQLLPSLSPFSYFLFPISHFPFPISPTNNNVRVPFLYIEKFKWLHCSDQVQRILHLMQFENLVGVICFQGSFERWIQILLCFPRFFVFMSFGFEYEIFWPSESYPFCINLHQHWKCEALCQFHKTKAGYFFFGFKGNSFGDRGKPKNIVSRI